MDSHHILQQAVRWNGSLEELRAIWTELSDAVFDDAETTRAACLVLLSTHQLPLLYHAQVDLFLVRLSVEDNEAARFLKDAEDAVRRLNGICSETGLEDHRLDGLASQVADCRAYLGQAQDQELQSQKPQVQATEPKSVRFKDRSVQEGASSPTRRPAPDMKKDLPSLPRSSTNAPSARPSSPVVRKQEHRRGTATPKPMTNPGYLEPTTSSKTKSTTETFGGGEADEGGSTAKKLHRKVSSYVVASVVEAALVD